MRHAVLALVSLSLILAAGTVGIVAAGREGAPAQGTTAGALPTALDGAPAPRIRLPDARGGVLDTRTLAGRPYVVTFVYTQCPDLCPVIGEDVAAALRALGPRGDDVAAVAVSVDPRGDTPAAARRWLARHRWPRQGHYLVGTQAELAPVWRDWYLTGGRTLDPATHSAAVWLVDRDGRLRARWPAGATGPAGIARELRAVLGRA